MRSSSFGAMVAIIVSVLFMALMFGLTALRASDCKAAGGDHVGPRGLCLTADGRVLG